MSPEGSSSTTSIILMTPPSENPLLITPPGLDTSTLKPTTSPPTTLSSTAGSSRPKLSHWTTSYRKLASKDPLREEEGAICATSSSSPLAAFKPAMTAYEEFYRDLAAKPCDDFLQVLQDGPPPDLKTPRGRQWDDASPRTAKGKQIMGEPRTRASVGDLLALTESNDGRNATPSKLTGMPKLFKLSIPARKASEPSGKALTPSSGARHRESSLEVKRPSGWGMGSIPDYPQTTADQVRESVKQKSNNAMDRTPWRHQRAVLGSITTAEDEKRREIRSVEAWMEWTARCVATSVIITDFARQSQHASSFRSGSDFTGTSQPSLDVSPTPADMEPVPMTNSLNSKVGEVLMSPGRSSLLRARKMSLSLSPLPAHFNFTSSGMLSPGQYSPSWTGDTSPFDTVFQSETVDRLRDTVAIGPRRNPLISLRPHTANRQIKPLLVELTHTMAHLVDSEVALRGDVSLEEYVKECDIQGNRRRSDMLLKLHDERASREESSREMVDWLSREVYAMMIDVDDALGPPDQFTRLVKAGGYTLTIGNPDATALGDELQLLVDLEELLWGMKAVSIEELHEAEE